MTTRPVRVAAAEYELAAARAKDEDRPIARVVAAAIRAYCAADTRYVEPIAPSAMVEAIKHLRDEVLASPPREPAPLIVPESMRAQLQAKIDAAGGGVKVAAEESLHAGRVPPSNGSEPVSVGDHSLTNDSSAACAHPNERVLAWGTVCSDCGKKLR